jgi:hypothetical protein
MFTIDVRTNLRAFTRAMDAFASKQLPFATAQALSTLAQMAADAEKVNEAKVLDRPRPFPVNAIRVRRATKASQRAVVWMMDKTAEYLRPYQFGGLNRLNSRALLKPIAAVTDLDQYGNLPRGFTRSLKGRSDIFVGTVQTKNGPVDGIWQRATEQDAPKPLKTTVNAKTGRVTVRKVAGFVPQHQGRNLRLLVKFADAHPVRQNLDWFGVAQRTVVGNFNREMGRALARAIASAK